MFVCLFACLFVCLSVCLSACLLYVYLWACNWTLLAAWPRGNGRYCSLFLAKDGPWDSFKVELKGISSDYFHPSALSHRIIAYS